MYRIILSTLILLCGCAYIPPPDELRQAEQEYLESRLDNNAEPGLCETPNSLPFMFAEDYEFAERMQAHCSISGLDVEAFQREYPTIEGDCLNCFKGMTKCAVRKCGFGICDPIFGYGPRHIKCRECTHNACGADMIRCSGLLPDQWPDFYRGPR